MKRKCPACGGEAGPVPVRNVALPHWRCEKCGAILAGLADPLLPCADPEFHITCAMAYERSERATADGIIAGPTGRGML